MEVILGPRRHGISYWGSPRAERFKIVASNVMVLFVAISFYRVKNGNLIGAVNTILIASVIGFGIGAADLFFNRINRSERITAFPNIA